MRYTRFIPNKQLEVDNPGISRVKITYFLINGGRSFCYDHEKSTQSFELTAVKGEDGWLNYTPEFTEKYKIEKTIDNNPLNLDYERLVELEIDPEKLKLPSGSSEGQFRIITIASIFNEETKESYETVLSLFKTTLSLNIARSTPAPLLLYLFLSGSFSLFYIGMKCCWTKGNRDYLYESEQGVIDRMEQENVEEYGDIVDEDQGKFPLFLCFF